MLEHIDFSPIWLTLHLAVISTIILVMLSLPLAWWLANTHSRIKPVVTAVVTLPLVLPPSVLGFYLLLLLGPQGWVGSITNALGLGTLPFTFSGLVIASIIYSLPFAVQPIHNAIQNMGKRPLEVASTLGASFWDRMWSIALPLIRPGLLTAITLSFAHTMGEFGVVLMIGGNIPGETKVISVAIYEHVESQAYAQAHFLAGGMLAFSFFVLLVLQWQDKSKRPATP